MPARQLALVLLMSGQVRNKNSSCLFTLQSNASFNTLVNRYVSNCLNEKLKNDIAAET